MSFAGPVISDFDGTITWLDIDWKALRSRLALGRINDIWQRADPIGAWNIVREAEIAAALASAPNPEVARLLQGSAGFAVLTNNSEEAVAAFFGRYPELAEKCRVVIGRESLSGPKEDRHRFEKAVDHSLRAVGAAAVDEVLYLGDQSYELEAAASLGIPTLRVSYYPVDDAAGTTGERRT